MSNDSGKPGPAQQAMVMWILWFSIFAGIFIIRSFAGPTWTESEQEAPLQITAIGGVGLAAAFAGMIVRWFIIPNIREATARLPAMVVGLALCEGCGIIGTFVSRNAAESMLMFTVSALCLFVSAPIYGASPKEKSPFRES